MILKLRQRMTQEESGFTLVELLVVMLILGILAAIAIPAFLNQRGKANDSDAKTTVSTAQTAMETFATDHNGDYTGAGVAQLVGIEPTLSNAGARLAVNRADTTGYKITVTAQTTGDTFSIDRAGGAVTYPCTGTGGGCPGTTWGP